MQVRAVVLATMLMLAPFAARAADLVVWWEEFTASEDQAVRDTIAAFEQKTGRTVDLSIRPQESLLPETLKAVEAGSPPDFVFGLIVAIHIVQWAHEGRLVDLTDAFGAMAAQFDRSALDRATTLDATTGRRGLHALPMAYSSRHVHVWRSLLERAGFTLADIPKEWKPFWDFWCDKVQPAVRKATGREDIYGVGLDMAPIPGNDTEGEFYQFVYAYRADYVTRDGRLVIDEPRVRAGLIKAIDDLAGIQRKGCNPPDAVHWDNYGNNKAFLEQKAVMTFNNSLSIPNALKDVRPDDYNKNVVTIEWPNDA